MGAGDGGYSRASGQFIISYRFCYFRAYFAGIKFYFYIIYYSLRQYHAYGFQSGANPAARRLQDFVRAVAGFSQRN